MSKLGHARAAGLSDSNIMLMVIATCSNHFLWRCTLSNRPLQLLVLLVVKQFTALVLG